MKWGYLLFTVIFFTARGVGAEPVLIPLSGEWKVMHGDRAEFKRTGFDDSDWPSVTLPSKKLMPSELSALFVGDSSFNPKSTEGYVWYRKKFHVSTIPSIPLLFQVREIMNVDEVYLNGRLIGSSGRFPPQFRSAWGMFRNYPVSGRDLVEGENVVAIRVYFNAEAWIMDPIRIVDRETGSSTKILHDFFLNHAMQGFAFLLFTIGLFFISFYRSRKSETEYLYFALTSFSLGITTGLAFLENLYPDIPLSSNNILRITQTGLVFFPAFQSLFTIRYLFGSVSRLRLTVTLLFPLAGTILMIIAKTRHEIFFYRNIFISGFLIFLIDGIVYYYRHRGRKKDTGNLFVIGLIPLFILGLHDIFAFGFNIINNSISLFVFGFPLLVIIIATRLIERFVHSLNEAEELNITLKNMMESISRFVPVQFIESLGKNKITDVALGDAILNNMTVLFLDIRNFTRLSSEMTPAENFEFLNSFLNRMEPSIKNHKGFVDKFIGDAIMALFADTADEAVRSAIEMRIELATYNNIRSEAGLKSIEFGVGINSGEVMLGTVGSSNRMDTTVIGNTVNLASRVEALTKVYAVPILITESVYNKLIEPSRYCIRELDLIQVRGIREPVTIYEVYDTDSPEQLVLKQKYQRNFQEAILEYRRGNFNLALEILKNCLQENPEDFPVSVYMKRCTKYIASPPTEVWRGVSNLTI